MYDMMIPAENMTSRLRDYVGNGAAMILDDGKGLLPQMNSGGRCKVYPGFKCPENWLDENPLPESGKREWIAKMYEGWYELNREIIMACDEDTIVARKIWKFDPDLKWDTDKTGVTVIGESIICLSGSMR